MCAGTAGRYAAAMEKDEMLTHADTSDTSDEASAHESVAEQLIADELLIEEISIDGMCGVY
jgi:mycofactocin precursor